MIRAFLTVLILFTIAPHSAWAEKQKYGERTQETIDVGEGRFLIFVGAPTDGQVGYTVDLLKIEDGAPFYIPLFMEEYDPETNKAQLGYGVAFEAVSYRYNKAKKTLDIRTLNPETKTRLDLHYTLDEDILHLKTVTSQPQKCAGETCKPKQLFKK